MEEGFSYRTTKDGRVFISWKARHVVTLKSKEADRFRTRCEGLDEEGLQLLMARMTGNFKRGYERSQKASQAPTPASTHQWDVAHPPRSHRSR